MKHTALVVQSVAIVASLLVGGCSSKSASITFEEFKAKIKGERLWES